ncbi:uncharacterized protein EDB91DRAFT_1088478 [Suillus paluster]|uniref:uncharacterized protein n=1 Tax=Suillus paluster TaxID=48578 RepID=UPI001B8790ED|nr:uncharacterized protein EDB91DRAFT_1088478 [Suillus paluster]KAG1721301.1 hypothetical protein EDB91DRAFT_1088478 [Suillus paluster]
MARYRQYHNTTSLDQTKPWGYSRGLQLARVEQIRLRSLRMHRDENVYTGVGTRKLRPRLDTATERAGYTGKRTFWLEAPSILLAKYDPDKRLEAFTHTLLHQICTWRYKAWLVQTQDLLPPTQWYPGIAAQGPGRQAARWAIQPKRTRMTPEPELFRRADLSLDSVSRDYREAVTGTPIPSQGFFAWDNQSVRTWRGEEVQRYVNLLTHEEADLEPRSLDGEDRW